MYYNIIHIYNLKINFSIFQIISEPEILGI